MKVLVMVLLGISLAFGAVNLNTASKQELTSIKGIGEKKAGSIILLFPINNQKFKRTYCIK